MFLCCYLRAKKEKVDIEMERGSGAAEETDPGIFFPKSLICKAVVALKLKVFVLTCV